jgi:hypothetical protein
MHQNSFALIGTEMPANLCLRHSVSVTKDCGPKNLCVGYVEPDIKS